MVRKAKKQAVTAKMYTHFAVVTLSATALLALFADGEGREAVAEAVEREEQNLRLAKNEAQERAKPSQQRPAPRTAWDFDEPSGDFGQPMDQPSGDAPGNSSIFAAGDYGLNENALFSALSQIGVDRAKFAVMSDEERRRAVDRAKARRERQIDRMAHASRARAGGGEGADM